jgi:hypothetical protein
MVWCEFSEQDAIDTHTLLGSFSLFHPPDPPPPQPPDPWESIAWAKKLEALQTARASGQIGEDEYARECEELMKWSRRESA